MKKNFHYVISATPANPTTRIKNYEHLFPTLKTNYNVKTVKCNPKEIDSITLSEDIDNVVIIDFWSENELPEGRELQSLRRVSEDLATHDSSVVIGKSHVLISS